MADDLDEIGPIDYIVVELPGNRMSEEPFPLLVDLVDRGLIRGRLGELKERGVLSDAEFEEQKRRILSS